jgi:hypothetical protein
MTLANRIICMRGHLAYLRLWRLKLLEIQKDILKGQAQRRVILTERGLTRRR